MHLKYDHCSTATVYNSIGTDIYIYKQSILCFIECLQALE